MFATITKFKVLAAAAVAATGLVAGTQQASAHDNFSFGISLGVPVYTAPVYAPAPVVVAPPAPVYAAPACPAPVAPAPTVVYQPAPVVVYQPAPVYYRPYWGWDHRGYDHHDWHR